MTNLDASEAVIIQLQKFIKENIEEFNAVYDEWPAHNQELDMPCCSIRTSGNPDFTINSPIFIDHIDGISRYQVGTYDLNIVIDIWGDSKQMRGELTNLLFDLFNKQFMVKSEAIGLSLALEDYHNTIARYDINGYNYNDSEEATQRNEYRTMVNILASCIRIQEKEESLIDTIVTTHSITDDSNDIDNPDIEEDYTIS